MKIYVTRHGETEWNTVKRMHGRNNANLTIQGIEDATQLGQRLKDVDFDAIYVSPLQRAVDTANYIKGDKNTPVILDDGLKEINFGKWEGMYEADVDKVYTEQFYNFRNKPELFIPSEGGESVEDVISRLKIWFFDFVNTCQEETVLLVTHGVVKRALFAILKNREVKNFWDNPYIDNTSLTIVEVKDGKIEFLLEADISHKN